MQVAFLRGEEIGSARTSSSMRRTSGERTSASIPPVPATVATAARGCAGPAFAASTRCGRRVGRRRGHRVGHASVLTDSRSPARRHRDHRRCEKLQTPPARWPPTGPMLGRGLSQGRRRQADRARDAPRASSPAARAGPARSAPSCFGSLQPPGAVPAPRRRPNPADRSGRLASSDKISVPARSRPRVARLAAGRAPRNSAAT